MESKLEKFILKWAPDKADELRGDLLQLPEMQYQNVALSILSDIDGTEVVIDSLDKDTGRVAFGPLGQAITHGHQIIYNRRNHDTLEDVWKSLLESLIRSKYKK